MHHARLVIAAVLLSVASVATADPLPRLEISPYVGYRTGGHYLSSTGDADFQEATSFGFVANYRAAYNTQIELLYGHQSTDIDDTSSQAFDSMLGIDMDFLHIGGTYVFSDKKLAPFLSLTIGATRLSPELTGIESETYFSGALGLGLRYDLAPNLGLRLEGRTHALFGKTNSLVFCGSIDDDSGCLFAGDGAYIPQFEISAGLSFRFK